MPRSIDYRNSATPRAMLLCILVVSTARCAQITSAARFQSSQQKRREFCPQLFAPPPCSAQALGVPSQATVNRMPSNQGRIHGRPETQCALPALWKHALNNQPTALSLCPRVRVNAGGGVVLAIVCVRGRRNWRSNKTTLDASPLEALFSGCGSTEPPGGTPPCGLPVQQRPGKTSANHPMCSSVASRQSLRSGGRS
jgi:hypothetical protein